MKLTPENKAHIEHQMNVIKTIYPWLGVVIFDRTEVKTREELMELVKKLDWEDYEEW